MEKDRESILQTAFEAKENCDWILSLSFNDWVTRSVLSMNTSLIKNRFTCLTN